ncbi:hypothetical protein [Planktotalea sp.]|uniref:hypothetical protein n=1 Tax=Planktotalea sp. TaxID=2029877 RepID=UPI0025F31CA5|nr:hypothetical protein [Planktotalea sp.]
MTIRLLRTLIAVADARNILSDLSVFAFKQAISVHISGDDKRPYIVALQDLHGLCDAKLFIPMHRFHAFNAAPEQSASAVANS